MTYPTKAIAPVLLVNEKEQFFVFDLFSINFYTSVWLASFVNLNCNKTILKKTFSVILKQIFFLIYWCKTFALQEDFRRVQFDKGDTGIFTSAQVKACMKKAVGVSLHEFVQVNFEIFFVY